MIYKSKKDWWLAVILWGALIMAIKSGVQSLFTENLNTMTVVSTVFLTLAVPLFILWLWLTVAYIIDEKELIVIYGPFKKRIPLNSIQSLKKTMNPISSPALSLKRIEIIYGQHSSVLISPKDRDEFIENIKECCPDVRIIN
ncbi:PH domain-containing protein [Halobacillus massiliensis]|uniref:PH domain-containing protein n=1 Tax=Halobacillus massiliensis TaxID=1926286 RepID=UPI0009E53FD8|nr:PH domain-containing protein [Halobacillus massiliensis]